MADAFWIDRGVYYWFAFEWTEVTHLPATPGSAEIPTRTRHRQASVDGWVTIAVASDAPNAYDPSAFNADVVAHARNVLAANLGVAVPTNAIVTFARIEPLAGYLDRFQTGTRPITKEN